MIDAVSQFHFIRPAWLLLALPAVALWWGWRRVEDPLRGWRDQMDPELLDALATNRHHASWLRPAILLTSWLLAIVIVAGPTWTPEPSPFAEDASPLIVLLKADASMEIADLEPSRLERARLKIADLADARKGQPLGLIAYAGSAHLVLPPTKDTKVVAQMAAEISPEIMPAPGDRLDLALARAGDLLKKQDTPGSILVVADTVEAEDHSLSEIQRAHGGFPVTFLAIAEPDSAEEASIRTAAHALRATVEPLTADGADIAAIVRHAAHPPAMRGAMLAPGTRWEEGGWVLLPVLVVLSALGFRREEMRPRPSSSNRQQQIENEDEGRERGRNQA